MPPGTQRLCDFLLGGEFRSFEGCRLSAGEKSLPSLLPFQTTLPLRKENPGIHGKGRSWRAREDSNLKPSDP